MLGKKYHNFKYREAKSEGDSFCSFLSSFYDTKRPAMAARNANMHAFLAIDASAMERCVLVRRKSGHTALEDQIPCFKGSSCIQSLRSYNNTLSSSACGQSLEKQERLMSAFMSIRSERNDAG